MPGCLHGERTVNGGIADIVGDIDQYLVGLGASRSEVAHGAIVTFTNADAPRR